MSGRCRFWTTDVPASAPLVLFSVKSRAKLALQASCRIQLPAASTATIVASPILFVSRAAQKRLKGPPRIASQRATDSADENESPRGPRRSRRMPISPTLIEFGSKFAIRSNAARHRGTVRAVAGLEPCESRKTRREQP